jgi:hypothetical protein
MPTGRTLQKYVSERSYDSGIVERPSLSVVCPPFPRTPPTPSHPWHFFNRTLFRTGASVEWAQAGRKKWQALTDSFSAQAGRKGAHILCVVSIINICHVHMNDTCFYPAVSIGLKPGKCHPAAIVPPKEMLDLAHFNTATQHPASLRKWNYTTCSPPPPPSLI